MGENHYLISEQFLIEVNEKGNYVIRTKLNGHKAFLNVDKLTLIGLFTSQS